MNSNLGSQESWERALSISGKIGTIPGLFSSTIRTLQLDQSKGGTLSPGGRHGIKTLFKGPSMKSAVYHAALTYRPEKLEQDTFQRASNLIKVFNPEELATIIAILFAYKKISRICQKYDLVWQERYKEMCRDIDLGALIGEALPKIGLSWGMLIPCINHMSLALMQSGILQKANSGGLAGFLLNQTINSAKEVYEARSKDCDASIINQVIYALTGFLRKKICRQLFGSEFQYCISGGAKLGIDTAKFFDSLGIQILEGYGLTETCVATNVNRPGRNKVGTVGPLVGDDIDIEIAMDGEILFRGPNVAIGYYGREKASKEAWDENGWFHTGDLGKIDDQGNLSIVGRKKEIIVSSYGKNLAPEPIEQLIKKSPLVSQSVLVGDGKAFCTAIITLDAAAVTRYGERPYENTEVKKLINEHLEKINLELPNHEKVRGFTIVPGDFTVENGLLTPTFKVKRKTVLSKYSKEIECLYFEK